MTFDLIIPCYNPPKDWEQKLIADIFSLRDIYPELFQRLMQIVIVDDGSTVHVTGSSLPILAGSGLPFQVMHNPVNRGKGFSIREGVRRSAAELCMYTDLDLPFGADSIQDIFTALEKGADIALGMRSKKAYYQHAPVSRKWMSMALMFLNKYALKIPFEDSQAGIKGFNRYGKALFLQTRTDEFLFDLEFIKMTMDYSDLRVVPVAVRNRSELVLSRFNLKIVLREILNFLRIIFKTKYGFRTKKNLAWN